MIDPHLPFFASPDLSGWGDVIALAGTVLPVYVLQLLHGHNLSLGIFQLITIVTAETIPWLLTARAWVSLRLLSCVVAYLTVNSIFTVGIMLWPFLEIPYFLLFLTVICPIVLSVGAIFLARATRPQSSSADAR